MIKIHTSDRNAYRRCRRRWSFKSPLRMHLTPDPAQEILAMWFGTGIHFALEEFFGYNRFGDPVVTLDAYLNAFRPEDLPEGAIDEIALGMRMMDYFMMWRTRRDFYSTLVIDGIPQVEVDFRLELRELSEIAGEPVIYQGTLDRVVEDPYGGLWVMEYKTAKNIDTNKLANDPQVRAYVWAAEQIYQRTFEGVLYLQLAKNAPEPPRTLNNGTISIDKRQKTVHSMAREAMLKLHPDGKFPAKYIEFLNELAEQETPEGDRFIRMDEVRINDYTKQITYQHIIAEAREMIDSNLALYPNPTRDCVWECSDFRAVCIAMDEGSDWEYMLEEFYKEKGEDRQEWKKRIKWPTAQAQ